MGSFNVGCGISNLSIDQGDEVGFVFMLPSDGPDYRIDKTAPHASYIYTTDLYKPFLPPIFGVYDDYGSIADIKESATTKVIEEIFGIPVEEVLNLVTSHRGVFDTSGVTLSLEATNLLSKMHGMFFLKEVYEDMKINEREDAAEWQSYAAPQENNSPFSTPERTWDAFRLVTSEEERIQEIRAKLPVELLNHLKENVGFFMERNIRYSSFPTEHLSLLTHYESYDEFNEAGVLLSILTSVNRMLIPSYNGEQFGNSKASLRLQKFTNRILEERLAQEEEDERLDAEGNEED